MSSLRNQRVVIASLFLPHTAVLGESAPPTPERSPVEQNLLSLPAITLKLEDKYKAPRPGPHTRQKAATLGSVSGPLKSIVEDLKDKVSGRRYISLSYVRTVAGREFFGRPAHFLHSPDIAWFGVYALLDCVKLSIGIMFVAPRKKATT